jgi:hypothetical protein
MKSGFAAALSDQMKVKGWDIAKLAREIETSYEFARRLTTGQSTPSRFMLKGICKMLGMDREQMWTLVVADKIQQKYGSALHRHPRVSELEPLLPLISEDQYQTLLGMVEGWAGRNRKNAVEAKIVGTPVSPKHARHVHAAKDKLVALAKLKSAPVRSGSKPTVHPGVLKSEETKEAKR